MEFVSLQTFSVWIIAGGAAYLGAYLAAKGRNLARKEDLDGLVVEVRAVTTVQKEVKAKIDGEIWDRQMRWNQRRDIYIRLLVGVERLRIAFQDARRLRDLYYEDPESSKKALGDAAGRAVEALEEFRQARAIASLFASPDTIFVLSGIWNSVEGFKYSRSDSNPYSFCAENEAAESMKAVSIQDVEARQTELVRAAKTDLGLEF